VRDLIQQQAAGLERIGTQVERAAAEVSAAATVGRGTLERLDEIMARGQVDSVVMHIEATTHALEEMAIELQQSLGRVGPALDRADSTFQGVGRVVARLERGEGTLGRLFMDTTLVARAESVLAQLDLLFADMRANPGRYIRLSIF
jgi:phospholipid/cholesterol/gamma-HCH transport system substrate-binding protein